MWEAELTGLPAKEEATEETETETEENSGDDEDNLDDAAEDAADDRQPVLVLQWQIGYTNRVSAEDADPPSLIEKYYYTITQTKAILAALREEISDKYIDNDELAEVRREIDESIGTRMPVIQKTVSTDENVLSPEPGNIYRWNVAAGMVGKIAFDDSHLPEEGDGAEIDIFISLGGRAAVEADGGNVTIADDVNSSGWYTLTAVNENGTVTAALYAKMGQTVMDGGRI